MQNKIAKQLTIVPCNNTRKQWKEKGASLLIKIFSPSERQGNWFCLSVLVWLIWNYGIEESSFEKQSEDFTCYEYAFQSTFELVFQQNCILKNTVKSMSEGTFMRLANWIFHWTIEFPPNIIIHGFLAYLISRLYWTHSHSKKPIPILHSSSW